MCISRRPGSLQVDAFRGHGLSLLAPARGMPALSAKDGFSRPSLKPAPASSSNASQYASSAQGSTEVYSSSTLSAGSSDTCYSRRTRNATTAFASHEENWFVFSRSHHPPLTRTSEVVVNAIPSEEIHGDSLKKNTTFSACDVSQRSFPCPAGTVAKVRPHRTKFEEAHGSPAESVVYFQSG